jgi:hypothetical protein
MRVQEAKELPQGFSIVVIEGPRIAQIPDRISVLALHNIFR